MPIDLAPASLQLARMVAAVPDARLGSATPCTEMTVGDLLHHVHTLAGAFTDAARKEDGPDSAPPPPARAADLPADWRSEIADRLGAFTEAWRDPAAWNGMSRIGGVDLPGEVVGLVGLNELIVHGWDLARSTGQPFVADTSFLELLGPMVEQFAAPADATPDELRARPFGLAVPVADDAPLLDRVLGLTGRDPRWRPPA